MAVAYFQPLPPPALLSTAPKVNPCSEKTGSQRCTNPTQCVCLSPSSGQIQWGERVEHKSSLSTACHSLPNRPKLVAACYRKNLSGGSKLCGATPNWTQAWLQLLYCSQLGYLECMAFTGCPHLGSGRVHTIASAVSALCTKMPPRHIHQNALCSHQNPQMDKCRTVFP